MKEDDSNEGESERETQECYLLRGRDRRIVKSSIHLLQKIVLAPFTRPAELVSVAKALHLLRLLPGVTDAEVTLRINLSGPRRWFGEHEIWHWWTVEVDGHLIQIYSGGHFYRQSTGGDSFTSFQWDAHPGEEPDYSDYLEQLQIVDDAQPFHLEVAAMDLTEAGFKLEVEDQDNPLLEEMHSQDERNESSDDPAGTNQVMTEAERTVARLADEDQGRQRGMSYANPSETCGNCGDDLNKREFFIDGRLRNSLMWSCLCAECFLEEAEGIGWGVGQLYMRQPDGEWLLVGGFPQDET